jgi:MYXO-CTERM domain-containing protein
MKKIMALFLTIILTFSFANTYTFAEEFPNTAKNGTEEDDVEDRDYSWLGLFGLAGFFGLRRRNGERVTK